MTENPNLTEAMIKHMVEMYDAGMTTGQIARIAGCSPATVYSRLFPTTGEPLVRTRNIDRGKVKALYKAHWCIKDIASDCGCKESEVMEILGL